MIIPEVGARIGGKYELLQKLSEGGGGFVWKVKEEEGREVALKILKISMLKSKEATTDRFKREFELFKKVSHPNIAKIYDFGYDPEYDIYYFTSELLQGGDLKKMIGAPLADIEVLLLQSLRALEYLRSFGILHLDIKPQNFLLRDGELALIDFGLAGFNPPERPGGTPNYMPPEVVLKRIAATEPTDPVLREMNFLPPIDYRSDLYSLGVTFYYILSGVQPFAVTNDSGKLDTMATMRRQLSDERPPPPSSHNPKVPPYLDAIIMRLMAKDPDDRYQSAILAAQALCFRSPNRLEPESRETISAYIPEEGMLIGRHKERKFLEELISSVAKGREEIPPVVCISGGWGTGKTRLLKSLKPFAQQQEMEVLESLRYSSLDATRPTAFLVDDPFLPHAMLERSSVPDVHALKHLIQYIINMPQARSFLAFTFNPELMPPAEMMRQLELSTSNCTVIDLQNFTLDEIKEYLVHLLDEPPTERIVEELFSSTFGNPRFVVEFFKTLMRRGEFFSYFAGRPGSQTLESLGFSFSHVASPPSLTEHVAGLVRALSPGAQLLAHRLACWQRPASLDELEKIDGAGTTDADLSHLLSSGLVKWNENEGKFLFSNPLASKIIESNIDLKERASIHDSIVRYLKNFPSKDELIFEIDRHLVFGSDPKRQKEAASRLAMESLKRLHPSETAELLHRVFDLMPEKEWEVRSELLVREGQAMARVGRWDDAKATFERLRILSSEKGPSFRLGIRADEQEGLLAIRRRRTSEARTIFAKAIDSLKGSGELKGIDHKVQMLKLENFLAAADLREGKYETAYEVYKRTAEAARAFPPEHRALVTNNELGETCIYSGRPDEAVEILKGELDVAKKSHHRERLVSRLRLLGDAYRHKGNVTAALANYQEALEFSQKYHLFEHQLRIRNSLANLLLKMGRWSAAIEQYKPALDLAMQLEGKATSVDIILNIGFAYIKLGQFDEAIEYLELALDFSRSPEAESAAQIRKLIPSIHVSLGHAHYEKKQYEDASEHLNTALEFNRERSLDDLTLYNLYGTLAEIDLALGRPADAAKRLPHLERCSAGHPEAKEHLKGLSAQIEAALKGS